jgi:Icc-related predicted phosphoesterase
MVRIAAAGDVHCGAHDDGRVREQFANVSREADILLLAGDLTNHGTPEEMQAFAQQLDGITIPVVAILGNHDMHSEQEDEMRRILEVAGVTVLEKETAEFTLNGVTVGVAGAKGFGGGFRGGCASTFGEREMRQFLAPTFAYGAFFESALRTLDTDIRLALMHFAPIPETLFGERWEIFPFLGAYQLGDGLDASGADMAFHGHAHRGCEVGQTPGGVPVRNVAQGVLRKAYAVYEIVPQRLTRKIPAATTMLPPATGRSQMAAMLSVPVGI